MKKLFLFLVLLSTPYLILIPSTYALGIIALSDPTEPPWKRVTGVLVLGVWTWVLIQVGVFF